MKMKFDPYYTYPVFISAFFSLFVLASIIVIAIENNFERFYFTLLYRYPYGTLLELLGYSFFIVGYTGILIMFSIILHYEYSKKIKYDFRRVGSYLAWTPQGIKQFASAYRHAIYYSGMIAVFSSIILIAVPGGIEGHRPLATLAVLTMFLHAIFRRAWWGVFFVFVFGIPTTLFWVVWPSDIFFSIFQTLLGGTLFFSIIFDMFMSSIRT